MDDNKKIFKNVTKIESYGNKLREFILLGHVFADTFYFSWVFMLIETQQKKQTNHDILWN